MALTLLAATIAFACAQDQSEAPTLTPSCPATTAAEVSSADLGVVFALRFAADLAGPDFVAAASGTKGEIWAFRTSDPPFFVSVQARRLDGSDPFQFELFRAGSTSNLMPIDWPGGGTGYLYGQAQKASAFRAKGCWRVRVTGTSPQDEIVIEAR